MTTAITVRPRGIEAERGIETGGTTVTLQGSGGTTTQMTTVGHARKRRTRSGALIPKERPDPSLTVVGADTARLRASGETARPPRRQQRRPSRDVYRRRRIGGKRRSSASTRRPTTLSTTSTSAPSSNGPRSAKRSASKASAQTRLRVATQAGRPRQGRSSRG